MRENRLGIVRSAGDSRTLKSCYLSAAKEAWTVPDLNALIFLVKAVTDLYLATFLVRLIMQLVRADFYNPFSQTIVSITNPLIVPARRILPSVRSVDVPTLVVLFLLQCAVTFLLLKLAGVAVGAERYLFYVVLRLASLTLWTYAICLVVYFVLSWVAHAGYSPIALVIGQIVGPILRPVRRIVPPIGIFDISVLLVFILIQAAMIALPLPIYLR